MSTIYAINAANAETCPVIQPIKPKSLVHPGGVFDPTKLQALKKLDATTVSELIKITPLDYKTGRLLSYVDGLQSLLVPMILLLDDTHRVPQRRHRYGGRF